MIRPELRNLLVLAALVFAVSCSDEKSPLPGATSRPALVDTAELPSSIEIEDPDRPITRLDFVEDSSEEVADGLLDFSDLLRRRDFVQAGEWLAPEFAGHALSGLEVDTSVSETGGMQVVRYRAESAEIVGRAGFLDSLNARIGAWERVESMIFKVKGAEFQVGVKPRWGKIRIWFHAIGVDQGGVPKSFDGWANARAERRGKAWLLTHFQLESMGAQERASSFFTDISASAGVAHTGERFGQTGNSSYAFNGAASADVDGDGRFDIFVPSDARNFLYIAQADGTYSEEAKQRGVAQPDAGTGAVFFDFDNDRDVDLVVGQIGWKDKAGKAQGRSLQLYRNDGEGQFEEVSAEFGLDLPLAAYSLTVLDYDLDGWLDLFVCGYGQLELEHNNDWIEATNGAPNALLRNLEGKGFKDVASEAGLRGSSWTYAAAAADVDEDGDPDIYVANDYGTNRLWLNDGAGHFENVAVAWGVEDQGNGMGVSFGDLTGDGLLDLYVSNMSSTAGNRILNRLADDLDPKVFAMLKKAAAGNTIFARTNVGFDALSDSGGTGAAWAWSSGLADFDLDGSLDIFCANGFVTGDLAHDT